MINPFRKILEKIREAKRFSALKKEQINRLSETMSKLSDDSFVATTTVCDINGSNSREYIVGSKYEILKLINKIKRNELILTKGKTK